VRGTVVNGIPHHLVVSRSSKRRRRVLTPFTLRSVGAVTSGRGAGPLTNPNRYPAASPLSTAPLPQALTAAR
jgi:hypothetical protein